MHLCQYVDLVHIFCSIVGEKSFKLKVRFDIINIEAIVAQAKEMTDYV